VRITFLGVGGGRFVVLKQLRASGGFVLELEDEVIHIDPGPGALVRAREYGVDLFRLTGVLVSHRHQDHFNDAALSIECMTRGATEKRGFLASTRSVIKGDSGNPPVFDQYHLSKIARVEILKPGKPVMLGRVRVTATPTKHIGNNCLGFVFEGECLRIGCTGDGEYFPGMEKHFKGCDYLIINVMRPRTDSWPGHMNSEGARKLISRARPGRAVLTHFGMKMLRGVAEREAAWLGKETGTKTLAARDGMVIQKGTVKGQARKGLKRFLEEDGD
jgi:phosphoribosyl 1,2-cyclic phosphodiesterase